MTRRFARACEDFELLAPDDRILVCLSGGKDSYTLLSMLRQTRQKVPFHFDLVAFHLDQGQPGYPPQVMSDYLATLPDVTPVVIAEDTTTSFERVMQSMLGR